MSEKGGKSILSKKRVLKGERKREGPGRRAQKLHGNIYSKRVRKRNSKMMSVTIAAFRRCAKRCRYADALNRTRGVCTGVQIVVEGTTLSSADGAEVFGPRREPGVVSMIEAMAVLRKALKGKSSVGTSSEVGVNEVAPGGRFVDSLRHRVLAAVVQWT